MNERYSDLGTPKQMQMRNRVLLGEERGGVKKAYVVSNLDILFDNELIDDFQRETGKIYWGWRTIARRRQGYAENPAYEETAYESEMQSDHTETEDGIIWEMFNILTGGMPKMYLDTIDACCNEADKDMPLLIIQAFNGNLNIFSHALDQLDKCIHTARSEFEKRCENVKNNVDRTLQKA
jgi:hypothetical protein